MNEKENNIELQQVTLATILKDSYILAQIKNDIKLDFFDRYSYKVIYKALLYFYNRYGKLPEKTDMIIILKDLPIDQYGSFDDVKKDLQELYDLPMSSLEFTADQVSRFIKKRRIEETLQDFLPRIRQGDNLVIDDLGEALAKNVAVSLHNSKAFMLSDETLLPDVRRESVGSDDNPTVIRSLIDGVNNSLLYKGYKSGDVIIVVAKPGCFTGNTRIMTSDFSAVSLESLYNLKRRQIMTYSAERDGRPVLSMAEKVYLSGYADTLAYIEIEGKGGITCTLDHPFLLSTGEYRKAEDLKVSDKVFLISREMKMDGFEVANSRKAEITKAEIRKLDRKVPVYGLYNVDTFHNYAVCPGNENDCGVIVKNCGKTMFMVNELANASRQGYNALHLFIGDMTDYDGFVRYLSNVSEVPQDNIVSMKEDEQIQLIRQANINGELDRITVKSYAAGEITVEQMIEDVFKIQNDIKCHYDIIAVDYPDNLVKESENMYDSGGDIYNRLSYLARRNKCVVLAGSQPKISYWNDEIIPLSGCAESSKKQHIADAIIALGKPSSNAELLTGFLAKVRRGTMGTIFRLRTNFSKAKIIPISEFEYISMKAENANSSD